MKNETELQRLERLIVKHNDAIEFHKKQIEKIENRIKSKNEMNKRGVIIDVSYFTHKMEQEQFILNELKTKNYKEFYVKGKKFYVTDQGLIYSETRMYALGRRLNGYVAVQLNNEVKYVHRVVWEAFNGKIPSGYEIDHINTNRADNRLENLKLVTSSENKRNPITIERYKKSNKNKGIVRMRSVQNIAS